jgi:hypothetical protein
MSMNPTGSWGAACRCFSLALAIGTTAPLVNQHAAFAQTGPASPEQAKADYQRALVDYDAAQQQYEALAGPYWKLVADKRQLRNTKRRNREPILVDDYVLDQPPVYTGPHRPVDPTAPAKTPTTRTEIPTVGDFLSNAFTQFQFVPKRPNSEIEFKTAYAGVAAEAGLTWKQIVRVYAFESGGNGKYDVQAGLEYDRPDARPISTALGYNQLLNTNSVELMAEKGDQFLAALRRKSLSLRGEDRKALDGKIEVLRRMIEFARSVPDDWSQHETLANMPQGLGIHAMNLDVDVGPLLQTQKLLDSVIFARNKGLLRELSASELEMMNLTGDGNGYDLVSMPPDTREQVPTSNFFQRGGYERNPVAIRHNMAASLFAAIDAKMDVESMLPGATELATAYEAAMRRSTR